MGNLTIFDVLFTNKTSDTYKTARESLTRVKDIVSKITMDFPDVTGREIKTIKNQWVELNDPIGKGVQVMGLETQDDYSSLMLHYKAHSSVAEHFHSKEYEAITVLEGECYDKTTNTTLKKGDVYVIPRNAVHHIVTKESECHLYLMFSSNKNILKLSGTNTEIARQMLNKTNGFKGK